MHLPGDYDDSFSAMHGDIPEINRRVSNTLHQERKHIVVVAMGEVNRAFTLPVGGMFEKYPGVALRRYVVQRQPSLLFCHLI